MTSAARIVFAVGAAGVLVNAAVPQQPTKPAGRLRRGLRGTAESGNSGLLR